MRDQITVFAPATVGNTACGFDVLGFCIEHPGDRVTIRLTHNDDIRITHITGDQGVLPDDPTRNTAGVAAQGLLNYLDHHQGIDIELHKALPIGSGLGSSAASAVASVFALNILLGEPLEKKDLLPFTLEAERVACGAAHADNAAPCLLGGFTLIRSYTPLDVIQIPPPEKLFCTICYPHIEVKTAEARKILKNDIPLTDAITQWGNVGGMVMGLLRSDYELIGRSLHDVVAEPLRASLIPGFYDIKSAALKAGALGCSISGSGPSIFAFSHGQQTAHAVGQAMESVCKQTGTGVSVYVSGIPSEGPRVITP